MDAVMLKQYLALKREIVLLEKEIERLRERREKLPEVMGKVTRSAPEFPYILEHISVPMSESIELDMLTRRINIKEQRKAQVQKVIVEIEEFIAGIPDSTDRQIFELVYLKGMSQRKVAEAVGYTQGRVSQKIKAYLKD